MGLKGKKTPKPDWLLYAGLRSPWFATPRILLVKLVRAAVMHLASASLWGCPLLEGADWQRGSDSPRQSLGDRNDTEGCPFYLTFDIN